MSLYLSAAEYLPHSSPMVLLEKVISVKENTAHCRVKVNSPGILSPFLDTQGNLPSWYALELMAQTIGVWSGWHRLKDGQQTIDLGMVLGGREFICAAGLLSGGSTLDIHVKLLMQDTRFGSFDCTIIIGDKSVATGRVNTFQPGPEELTLLFKQGYST